jgi:hypothetical protein
MTKYVDLNKLRPNNWFLDKKKLENIRTALRDGKQHLLPAIFVTTIDGELSLLDGHCRAYVAWENGAMEILAQITDPIKVRGNIELLTLFHQQGPSIGIRRIADLGRKIIDTNDKDVQTLRTA